MPENRRESRAGPRESRRIKGGWEMKSGTPDSPAYAFTFFLARLWLCGRGKPVIDDRLLRGVKPPYILLANHESFEDFSYVSRMAHPRLPSYLVNRYYCTRPFLKLLAKRMGVLPKKLFTRDVSTGLGILRTVRKGFPLVIFPEGRLSPDGRSNPIVESGAGLFRAVGTDLVLTKIDGAYFAHPKWRKKAYRSAVHVSIVRVLHPEEMREMSNEEIDRAVSDALYNDASASGSAVFPQKDKAAGLETLLYRCAFCGALYQTRGVGNEFMCRACGRSLHLDETYHFTQASFSIPAYYDVIRRMEAKELKSLSLRAAVRVKIFGADGRARREAGLCALTPESFSYRSEKASFSIPTEELPALAFSCGKEFELYHGDELYYFYPKEEPNQAARWALAVDLLAEERRAGTRVKGSGDNGAKAK